MTNFPHTEHRLAPREFPLITNDPANPASGRRVRLVAKADLSSLERTVKLIQDTPFPTPYQRGYEMGRKSVDRWAPAFFGGVFGCILTALIILAGSSVLS